MLRYLREQFPKEMRVPRYRRCLRATVIVATLAATSGCSTPTTGTDAYENGRQRVLSLALETTAVLPADAHFVPRKELTLADTDREICHKKFAGYAYAQSGARQPEITTFAELNDNADPRRVLDDIEQLWRSHKYTIDRSGLSDRTFPKIRARTGDYTLTATSFSKTAGFVDKPRVAVYVVARCLND